MLLEDFIETSDASFEQDRARWLMFDANMRERVVLSGWKSM